MINRTDLNRLERILAVILILAAFVLGMEIRIVQELCRKPKPRHTMKAYFVEFKNRKCEFCGAQPAAWFEYTAKKGTNDVQAEYLCTECHEFLRYGEHSKHAHN